MTLKCVEYGLEVLYVLTIFVFYKPSVHFILHKDSAASLEELKIPHSSIHLVLVLCVGWKSEHFFCADWRSARVQKQAALLKQSLKHARSEPNQNPKPNFNLYFFETKVHQIPDLEVGYIM